MGVCVCSMTTKYINSKELLEEHFKKGDKVGNVRLTELIMINLGGDPRTVSDYLRVMMSTHLIKDIGNCHWRIL